MLKYIIKLRLAILMLGSFTDLLGSDPRVDAWETTETIWNFGVISLTDKGMVLSPINYFKTDPPLFNQEAYHNIQSGDVVWVQCRFLGRFYKEILPVIQNPFVLVVTDGDESFPSNSGLCLNEIEDFLANDLLIHIFAQNSDYTGLSNKVSHLPIGMDFHTVAYKGIDGGWGEKGSPSDQEHTLKNILNELLPTDQRILGAFVDFQLSDSMHGSFQRYLQFGEDRTSIFHRLMHTGLIEYAGFLRRTDLWKKKGKFVFSISPHGNGLDCHRTWEDLVLGCIVIVKTSTLDPMYEGLPVVIVNDWSEITKENLETWLSHYHDASTNPNYREKLTNSYWIKQIQDKAKPYKTESPCHVYTNLLEAYN